MRLALPRKLGALITSVALVASLAPVAATAKDAPLDRADVIRRAKTWTSARVPYSQVGYLDGYRRDCSGFVSMAWGLPENLVTWRIPLVAERITKAEILPGDVLLDYESGSKHVVMFERWANAEKTAFWVLESTGQTGVDSAVRRVVPYPYRVNQRYYKPWRYVSMDRYWTNIPPKHRQPVAAATPIKAPTVEEAADARSRAIEQAVQPVRLDEATLDRKLADLNGDGDVQAVETSLPIAPPLATKPAPKKRPAKRVQSEVSSETTTASVETSGSSTPAAPHPESLHDRWVEADRKAEELRVEAEPAPVRDEDLEELREAPSSDASETTAAVTFGIGAARGLGIPSPLDSILSTDAR